MKKNRNLFLFFALLSGLIFSSAIGCNGSSSTPVDTDKDQIADAADNCPMIPNPRQEDTDQDGLGDACDPTNPPEDSDGDGIEDTLDNCPETSNPDQENSDSDLIGDACDDSDGDGLVDAQDNCPVIPNPGQENIDSDSSGDACDDDSDGDGVMDSEDNCQETVNPDQRDFDEDGLGNLCDADPPLSQDYIGSAPETFDIFVIDTVNLPTRLKITQDGQHMFIGEYGGRVLVFNKSGGKWLRQNTPVFQVNGLDLGIAQERGMTGLFFGADFDPDSTDPLERELFLTYQVFDDDDDQFKNRIARMTLEKQGSDLVGTGFVEIYEGPQEVPAGSIGAHQIEDGIGFIYEGVPHILVAIADGFLPVDALDESKEGRGKIILLQRDGTDPLGTRPFANPRIQAKGIRNPYSMLFLPETDGLRPVDPRRRVLGMENGNNKQDRLWLLELIDFGHEQDDPMSLGYTGSDQATSWTQIPDVNTPDPGPDTQGVLGVVNPLTSPTCAALHAGGGVIEIPGDHEATFVATEFGNTRGTNDSGRDIVMGVIDNLDTQPVLKNLEGVTLKRIIQRSPAGIGRVGNPLALDVDPTTGDILFTDLFTGELHQAVLVP